MCPFDFEFATYGVELRVTGFEGGGDFGARLGHCGLPEVARCLRDRIRQGGGRGERVGVRDAGAQVLKPGLKIRTDRIGAPPPNLQAHPLDGGPRALQEESVGSLPDVRFADAAGGRVGHSPTPVSGNTSTISGAYRSLTIIKIVYHTYTS